MPLVSAEPLWDETELDDVARTGAWDGIRRDYRLGRAGMGYHQWNVHSLAHSWARRNGYGDDDFEKEFGDELMLDQRDEHDMLERAARNTGMDFRSDFHNPSWGPVFGEPETYDRGPDDEDDGSGGLLEWIEDDSMVGFDQSGAAGDVSVIEDGREWMGDESGDVALEPDLDDDGFRGDNMDDFGIDSGADSKMDGNPDFDHDDMAKENRANAREMGWGL